MLSSHLTLRGFVFALYVAASGCGGGTVAPPRTAIPAPSSGAEVSLATAASPAAPSSPATHGATGPASSAISGPVSSIEMKPPQPTAMGPALTAIGLDPRSLPPIENLEPRVLRAVMTLMARSLGVKCVGCHQEGDFAAPTAQKRVAAKMWDEFVGKLALSDGAALFCDSCHQGRVQQLDRSDKKRLARWMDENFVGRLNRKDAGDHGCETCHVAMEMTFLTTWRTSQLP